MIISIVYLCIRVDFRKTSIIIFILCIVYASLFVFLNIIAVFDLFFNSQEAFEKLMNFLSKFYYIFSKIDKALGFYLFNLIIYYLESGYDSKLKKLLWDMIIRKYRYYMKKSICEKIVIVIINVSIISVVLTFLIIYRDHFGLGNKPYDYLCVLLDCYAVFEIYTCVGFFIVQIFKDKKIERNNNLTERYCRYSIMKIIEKTEKYINKIKETYVRLNTALVNPEKNKPPLDIIYLQKRFEKVKEKKKLYIKEGNNAINNTKNNLENNNIPNTNIVTINNTIDNYSNTNMNINNGDNIYNQLNKNNLNEINKQTEKDSQEELTNETGDKGDQNKKIEINVEENVKKKEKEPETEEDLPTCIRKYKKAVRRIEKFKKLYKEFQKDLNIALNKKGDDPKKCSCLCVVLFVAFFMAILTDFILPIVCNYGYEFEDEKYEKEKSMISIVVGAILVTILSVLWCAYTIIIIYTTKRRRYITGDFLYDRKINDNLSLMKTVQLVCGYSFALVHCNLFYYKTIDKFGKLGKPIFYEEIIIPDYSIKWGISVYMIVKIIIIVLSIIATLKFSSVFAFQNDLAEYDLSEDGCKYDNQKEFDDFLKEKKEIVNILNDEEIN